MNEEVISESKNYDTFLRTDALLKLMKELKTGQISAEKKGWISEEEVIYHIEKLSEK